MVILKFNEKYPKIDSTVFIDPTATIIGDVQIDSFGSIWPNAVLRGDSQSIKIGKNVNIQDNVVIHTESNNQVTIGNNVSVGHGAILHGCIIGDNVLIGMGSLILDNARINDWVLIGAGAIVTPDTFISSKSLAFGIPCKVVRQLDDNDIKYISSNAKEYVALSRQYKTRYEKL